MIYFLGPLPAPVHGFSLINEAVFKELKSIGPTLHIYSSKWKYFLFPFVFWVILFRLLFSDHRNVLYVGFSAGYGRFYDLIFVVLFKLFGSPVFIHHHSFAYVNRANFLDRLIFFFLRSSVHIVLCARMGNGLMSNFAIPFDSIEVVSNAAFLKESSFSLENDESPVLKVFFLSNITKEKGIFDFFDVVDIVSDNSACVEFTIVGPVASTDSAEFHRRLKDAGSVKYLGSLYNEDKLKFIQTQDVLIFPTKYVNEAEPVTILEAALSGVFTIAWSRGCIGDLVPGLGGYALSGDSLVKSAADKILSLSCAVLDFRSNRKYLINRFVENKRAATENFEKVLDKISGCI